MKATTLLLCALAAPAAAEEPLPPPVGLEAHIHDGILRVSLADAVRLTLLNDATVRVSELQHRMQSSNLDRAHSAFDPAVGLSFGASRSTASTISALSGAPTLSTNDQNARIEVHQRLLTGTGLGFSLGGGRGATNSTFARINPSFSSSLSFAISQPLLRNFGLFPQRAPLQIAQRAFRQSEAAFQSQLAAAVSRAVNVYWDAVETRENLRVQQRAMAVAERTQAQKHRELELGAISPLDIHGADQAVAGRRVGLISAEFSHKRAVDQLRTIIGADLDRTVRELPLELTESPSPTGELVSVDEAEAVTQALARRPERVATQEAVEIAGLNLRLSRQAARPELNLNASYTYSGVGGTEIDTLTTPPTILTRGGIGDALAQVRSRNFPSYNVNLQLSFPWRNRAARAALADAHIAQEQTRYTLRRQTQDITLEVRQVVHNIEQAKLQMNAARLNREIAQKYLAAEQRKHELGVVTLFFLLEAQSRMLEAEVGLLQSEIAYQRAVTEVQRVTGGLLREFQVDVRPVDTVR
jgi:outer membrane protein TolC